MRAQRLGLLQVPNRQRSTASRRKTTNRAAAKASAWRRGPTYSRTGPQRTEYRARCSTKTQASSAASPSAGCCQGSCARTNDRGGAGVRAETGHPGPEPAEEHGQQNKKHRGAATRVRWWCCGPSRRRRRTYKVPGHVDKEHCHSGLDLHEAASQMAPTSARPPNSSANTNAHQKGAANSASMGLRNQENTDSKYMRKRLHARSGARDQGAEAGHDSPCSSIAILIMQEPRLRNVLQY